MEKKNPCILLSATMENSMVVPQKIKNRTTKWSNNSTFGYLFKENKNMNSTRDIHPIVHCALFTIVKTWKQPECSWIGEQIRKTYVYVHTHGGILFSDKREVLLMDLEGIMLSEIRQRKTNTAWSHLNVKSKTKQNKLKKPTKKRLMISGGRWWWQVGEMNEGSQKIGLSIIT